MQKEKIENTHTHTHSQISKWRRVVYKTNGKLEYYNLDVNTKLLVKRFTLKICQKC